MTKTLIITCDVCDADITQSSKIEITWTNANILYVNRTYYFCGKEHFYEYLDKKRGIDE